MDAAIAVGQSYAAIIGGTAAQAFQAVHHSITLAWVASYKNEKGETFTSGAITKSAGRIEVASLWQAVDPNRPEALAFPDAKNNIVHEFGHTFASLWWVDKDTYDQSGPYGTGQIPGNLLNEYGFYPSPESASYTWRQHPGDTGPHEILADMYTGWAFGVWANDFDWSNVDATIYPEQAGMNAARIQLEISTGVLRDKFMTTNMAEWVVAAANR